MIGDDRQSDAGEATAVGQPRRRSGAWLPLVLLALIVVIAIAGYALRRSDVATRWLGLVPATMPVATGLATKAVPSMPARADSIDTEELARRVARLEAQTRDVAARASAASGNADRAEGLLLAFAARRALDRGIALGYLEGLLRERFGANNPQAVATVLGAARTPVTLAQLSAEFDAVGPTLAVAGPNESWWSGVRRELAGLIIVRRANTPSAAPADRLARARTQLESGNVEAALAEVERMPGRAAAARWIMGARRYVEARRALDRIETAALLAPHGVAPASAPLAPSRDPLAVSAR